MIVAEVSTGPAFSMGAHRQLFDTSPYVQNNASHYYALSPDDRRFLMVRPARSLSGGGTSALVLVENWLRELDTGGGSRQR